MNLIEGNGFIVNNEKIRMFSRGSRQKVTGLVVNDKVSIGRRNKKTLRAIVHNVLKNGPVIENKNDDPFFRERIFGHLGCTKIVDPDFAVPLIESLKNIDWFEYEKCTKELKECELNVNSLRRMSKTVLIKFDELGFFRKVIEFPEGAFTDSFKNQLDCLKEKCDVTIHGVEACSDCLDVKKEIYSKCMKYVIGHYTGTTGGHHHGHEIYDMKAETDLYGNSTVVAFLMKSIDPKKKNTSMDDNLFRQFFNCTSYESIDLIAIVANSNLKNELCENLELLIKGLNKGKEKEQLYCLVMRNEMKRILYDFQCKSEQNMNFFLPQTDPKGK